jgi:multiple sugar transport system substrate-binding protein
MQVVRGTINTETIVNRTNQKALDVSRLETEYVRAVKNDVVIDGKIYGLPLSVDTLAVFYNKDLLDCAQIAEPPKTWEEFQKLMEKLTKYDKDGKIIQSGTALGTGNNVSGFDDLLFTLFKQSGLDFVDRTGRPTFQQITDNGVGESSNPAMQVINFYTDFANPNRKTYSWNENMGDSLEKFVNGSVGFFFGYSYHYPVIKARAPQLNFGVLPLFQLNPDNPANAANYWVQTVTAKSPHQDAAWALVDYLGHSEATKEYLDKTGRPSSMRMYLSEQLQKPELAPFVSQVLVADSWYRGVSYDAANKALSDMVHEWLQPNPETEDPLGWRQKILNRAASKIEQTL